tara:strand:+ start:33870 stop:34184 length:315 start_codon:yes stop_codon:yes gene_type:complete
MKSIVKLSTILVFSLLSSVGFAGDASLGKTKSETCLGCHAIPGYNNVYPTYKVPKLAGQHAEYITSALKAYQSKERDHKTMHANAMALTDEDIQDIAKYFESLK